MIFTKTDPTSCTSLVEILQSYEKASGQMINAQKSSISFSSKTPTEIRSRVKQQLGINKEGGVGKYLGLPELFGRKKRDLFASIVDRMRQKVASWSTQFLSLDRKATMIQSVLSAIPNFASSSFLLPVNLCKQIQSVLTRFWWDPKDGDKKSCWKPWDSLTQPKSLGGLGFRDVQDFNQALLAKVAWRILRKPNSLLARILLSKYCHKTSFTKVQLVTTTSHGWRGIIAGRDLLLNHLGKVIGDGESTKLWSDSWIHPNSNLKPIGPVPLQAKDLMVSDILTRETKEWNKDRILNLVPELYDRILDIKPSTTGAQDAFIWPLEKTGDYSVKTGYFSIHSAETQSTLLLGEPSTWNWNKHLWSPPLQPKLKFFL